MEIPKLLEMFPVRKYVEVVVPSLPERPLQPLYCDGKLERFQSCRQHHAIRFTHKKVHTLTPKGEAPA
jgi:hypothetical protein